MPTHKTANILFLNTLLAIMLLTTPSFSYAGATPSTTCDPKIKTAMEKKAEAVVEEETQTAAEFIKKPESTLQLSCYDKWAADTGAKSGQIFSDAASPTNFSMSQNVANISLDPLSTYISDSFGGGLFSGVLDYLGGILGGFFDFGSPSGGLQGFDSCSEQQTLWDSEQENLHVSSGDIYAGQNRSGSRYNELNSQSNELKQNTVDPNTGPISLRSWQCTAPHSETNTCCAQVRGTYQSAGKTLYDVACTNPGCRPNNKTGKCDPIN